MPTPKLAVLTLLLLPACLDPKPVGDSNGDDTASGPGPTVFDVNDGTVAEGSAVTLEGLVVTSPVNRAGDGFFVADPAGGPNSGLYVWRQLRMDGLVIAVGDEVRITGTIDEFHGWMELVISSVDDIEITGKATLPSPVDLGQGAGVDWEEYESVLVTLSDQTVTDVDSFDTGTLSSGIKLDDGFRYLQFECRGSFATLTGIVFYEFETHSLNPRIESDLGAYTAPAAVPGTVAAIQAGHLCGPVTLDGVVATTPAAEEAGSSLLFVQDAGGGPGSGIAVSTSDTVVDVSVGGVYRLTGTAEDYFGFTQLRVADAATNMTLTGTGTPTAESLVEAPADWEPYEGMLLTLVDVVVTSEPVFGEVRTNYGIELDTLYHEHEARLDDTFAAVTGVVYYNFDEWKLVPRDAADLVP